MSYEISISETETHVVIRVDEPMTIELAREVATKAADRSAECGLNKYVCDVRKAPNVESVLANYQWARKDMAALGLDKEARFAILASPDDDSHDLVETVMRNAGYNVRLFTSKDAAVEWVEADPSH